MIPKAIDELYDILRPLRVWLFKNNIRRHEDGLYHITLPAEAAIVLEGLQVAYGFRIHYDAERRHNGR